MLIGYIPLPYFLKGIISIFLQKINLLIQLTIIGLWSEFFCQFTITFG